MASKAADNSVSSVEQIDSAKPKHRTSALNLTHVANYPKKLVIYQLTASPFWWVRYYSDGKILRRSTKETDKRLANEFAKGFYDEVNYKQRQGLVLKSRADFEMCADALLEQQDAKVQRGEMSAMMQQNDRYRLQKEVLRYFRSFELKNIDYFVIEKFINKLSADKLTVATISNYLGLVRKTLSYAQRKGYINAVPQFPKLKKVDAPRGWFNTMEYRKLWSAARKLSGQTQEIRKLIDKGGKAEIFTAQRQPTTYKPRGDAQRALQEKIEASQLLRRVEMTEDLRNLIVFMTNSFIRPTDIKWMQHKHIEVIEGENTYLRMSLPTSKKHDKPIVSMAAAVHCYRRQRAFHWSDNKQTNNATAEDYVFLPSYGRSSAAETKTQIEKRRGAALTQLQRQFSVLLAHCGLAKGARGEERSLYSLRHTCIMYRLLYGEGLDLLTLARNARTSTEMIERFYASHLEGEMNIEMLQSRRGKNK